MLSGSLYVAGHLAHKPGLADTGLHTLRIDRASPTLWSGRGSAWWGARGPPAPDNPYDVGFGRGFGDEEFRSFPSGHSATAFAAAAAGTGELGRWAPKYHTAGGVVLYSGATLVGLSRMYHQRHWASDVMVGTAIGAFSGWKIVHYNHAHPGNRLDRLLLGRAALPHRRAPHRGRRRAAGVGVPTVAAARGGARVRERRPRLIFRDLRAGEYLDLVLVAAVSAVLLIRFFLALTGYPTVGGGTLHIAHMLWGGLLMLVALVLLLAFLGRFAHQLGALLGGFGFGTFIDELGKFITRDNDYFYRPPSHSSTWCSCSPTSAYAT